MEGNRDVQLPESASTRSASRSPESDWDIIDRLTALPVTSRETHIVSTALAAALMAILEEVEA